MPETTFPRHLGGGWVETSDGAKHRGWDRARAHQVTVDGPAKTGNRQKDRPAEKAAGNRAAQEATPKVKVRQVKVLAVGPGWGRSEWQGQHMPEALRFDGDGAAWLTVERNGAPIAVDFVGPSGPYKEPVIAIVARQADFAVTDETRILEVAS